MNSIVNSKVNTDEALKLALEALENINNWLPTIGQKGLRDYEADAITAIKAALAQPDTDMAYTIALQRAIEWHCDGKAVPPDVAELCPYHAEKLNTALAQEQWTPEDTAYRPGGLAQPEQEPVLLIQSHRESYWCVDLTCSKCYSADFRLKHAPPKEQPDDFDSWYASPYAKVLMKSIDEDYSPKRQPLTDGEIYTAYVEAANQTLRPQDERIALAFARAIEAAHGIGDKT